MEKLYFSKYLKQKDGLPTKVRQIIEIEFKDTVLFYAMADLDEDLMISEFWIILGRESMYTSNGSGVNKIYCKKGSKVVEQLGTVANTLSICHEKEISVCFWYSQKQNVLFAQLKYLLEERLKGSEVCISSDADSIYQQSILKPLMKNQSSSDVKKNKVVWRLLGYLLPYKRELILGSLGAICTTIVSLLPAYISGRLIDDIIKPVQDGNLGANEALQIGWVLIIGLTVTYFLKEFFIWVRLKKMSILGEKVARDLRTELFNHIQRLDMSFFANKQTGSIISRVSSDTDRIWDFVAFGIVEVSISLITLTSLALVLISLDMQLGLIMTIPVPLMIFSIFKHGQRMQKMFLRCWRKWAELTGVLSDAIPGIQVVKSFNQEDREIKRFGEKNEATVEEFNNVHEAWTSFWPLLMASIHIVMISVWVVAMPRLVGTPGGLGYISAGTFVSFMLYMTMFSQPIEVIGQMARMLNRATSSAYRIFEILDTKSAMDESTSVEHHKLEGEIEFKNVIFSYDGVRNVLKGINFSIKKGEMIGLVGPSGSGKSTITKLINRFYDVSSGNILIDGKELKNLEVGFLRKQIAVVHQDPYLFHGSLIDNIRYGNEKADLIEVINAAKIANAHEFIMGFKDAYDTVVGERGQTLSGGERQRISIARAILNNPKLLILDEATSAVDTETERKIQDSLDKLIEGRTVIAIAHRLSTLRKANRIFVIKAGEIAEEGTHHELMETKGEYRKLQDMQTEMFNLMHGKEEKGVTDVV
ncbi:MAG: ATP-binding cassette subfamily B protein [Bacteriovoracaceae bacterium]|jgi:ATP-binding cassette subfamily B protein